MDELIKTACAVNLVLLALVQMVFVLRFAGLAGGKGRRLVQERDEKRQAATVGRVID